MRDRKTVCVVPAAIRRLLPALIAAACTTAAPSPSAPPQSAALPSVPLTDVRWRLVELDGRAAAAQSAERAASLRFAAGDTRVSGFTTCNHLFGSYDASGGDRLRLSDLGSTRMACVDPALAQQEQRFIDMLQRVDRFAIAGDTLTLLEGTRPLGRFVADTPR